MVPGLHQAYTSSADKYPVLKNIYIFFLPALHEKSLRHNQWCLLPVRFITDNPGITKASNIYAISLMKIIAPELTCIFTDTINSNWFNDSLLRAIFFGDVGPNTAMLLGQ